MFDDVQRAWLNGDGDYRWAAEHHGNPKVDEHGDACAIYQRFTERVFLEHLVIEGNGGRRCACGVPPRRCRVRIAYRELFGQPAPGDTAEDAGTAYRNT